MLVLPGHVRDAQERSCHLEPSSSSRAVWGRCCWGVPAGARQPPKSPPPHACCELAAVPLLLPKKFPLGSLGEICAQAQLLTTARPPLAPGGGWGLLHGTPPPRASLGWGDPRRQDLGSGFRGSCSWVAGGQQSAAGRAHERAVTEKVTGEGGGG